MKRIFEMLKLRAEHRYAAHFFVDKKVVLSDRPWTPRPIFGATIKENVRSVRR